MAAATELGCTWDNRTGGSILFFQNFFTFAESDSILYRANAGRIHNVFAFGLGFMTSPAIPFIFLCGACSSRIFISLPTYKGSVDFTYRMPVQLHSPSSNIVKPYMKYLFIPYPLFLLPAFAFAFALSSASASVSYT